MPAFESHIRHGAPPYLPSTPHLRAYRIGTGRMLLHLVWDGEYYTTYGYLLIKSVAFRHSSRVRHQRRAKFPDQETA